MLGSRLVIASLVGVLALVTPTEASMSSVRRELRQMVGYTIVGVGQFTRVRQEAGKTYVDLRDGKVFEVETKVGEPLPPALLRPPLVPDVIVFAKVKAGDETLRYGALPQSVSSSFKLLFGDDIVTARRIK